MKIIPWRFSVLMLAWILTAGAARANVYATDMKFDGSRTMVTSNAGGNLNISYILNEPATLGVAIHISSGTNLIRTISVAAGANGTLRGANLVRWDGNDSHATPVAMGIYTVSVVASATGYTNWTQISHDNDTGNHVYDPRGVAVDNNSNSLYYGRVFIGSAGTGPQAGSIPGDSVTILKLNADGTFADDGPSGNGGFAGIFDDGQSDVPQKLRVAEDDRLYMMDITSFGEVVAFDMALTTNQVVFNQNNYAGNPFFGTITQGGGSGWFSMDVTGAGTSNSLLWLGDIDPGGAGVWNWHLVNGVADTNDSSGNWAVATGGSLSMAASGGLMVDSNFDIFVGQFLNASSPTDPACIQVPNWNNGLAFNGNPVTNSTGWAVGADDADFLGVYDTTIDSRQTPKYVACAITGGTTANGIRLLDPLTGDTIVTNLDPTNLYFATAWDAVGNLYAVSGSAHLLRVFSPPSGVNTATTTAVIQTGPAPPAPPAPIAITYNRTNLLVTIGTSAANIATNLALVGAPVISGPYQTVTNVVVTQINPGLVGFSTPLNAAKQFYEVVRNSGQ